MTVDEHEKVGKLLRKYYELVKTEKYLTREIDSNGLSDCTYIYMCEDKVKCDVQSVDLRTVVKCTLNITVDELEKLGVKDEYIQHL